MQPYTLVITSCGRHELLRKTLASFQNACGGLQPRETIIIEDGPAERPEWLPRHNTRWLSNGTRRGQIYSIDRAYDEVKTEYIFHCEDDWMFLDTGFIEESFEILEKYPDVLQVWLRGIPTLADIRDRFTIYTVEPHPKYPLSIAHYHWPGWEGGFSFNPGLRRLSDYCKVGSYGLIAGYIPKGCGERAIGKAYHALGYTSAILPKAYVSHWGDEAHVDRSTAPELPRMLIAIPTAEVLDYDAFRVKQRGKWGQQLLDRYPDGISGLQKNGKNERKTAVAETWMEQAKLFPNVSAEFFDGPRCGCPDDHMHVIEKFQFICRYALEQGFDLLFKCDDDSYVRVDRLVRQGCELTASYAGIEECNFAPGGPGFWLDRKAMQLVADAVPPPRDIEWREDSWVGDLMREHGIKLVELPGLYQQNLTGIGQMVTLHPVSPEEMRRRHREIAQVLPNPIEPQSH